MRKGDQTRERILLRAARVFNEKGYTGASLADIMKATGLEKGGIYNHFESKEKLALEAFDYSLQMIGKRFERNLSGKTHAADRLLGVVAVFDGYVEDPPVPGGCPVMNTAIDSDDGNPALRKRARQAMDWWRGLIVRTVAKGVERGELRRGADPEEVASLMISTVEGGIMMSKLYGDPVHVRRALGHLRRHIEKDLRA
ncbi:MAG: TetR/AcrR family transcriptional regulator [Acidobacteria bacterium]|nr:TetR/AcrR family transcriptional regulator [Acidobacteriota bacterium]MBI3472736.1 TetR/AcrR family transcriptional regulator [Candidatus Solibacter usitatus]